MLDTPRLTDHPSFPWIFLQCTHEAMCEEHTSSLYMSCLCLRVHCVSESKLVQEEELARSIRKTEVITNTYIKVLVLLLDLIDLFGLFPTLFKENNEEMRVGEMKHTSIISPPLWVQEDAGHEKEQFFEIMEERGAKVDKHDRSFSLLGVMKHKAMWSVALISWSIRILQTHPLETVLVPPSFHIFFLVPSPCMHLSCRILHFHGHTRVRFLRSS